VRAGDAISVRWRTIRSIASGNSWSKPLDARVLWFRPTRDFWLLGFQSPHTNDEQVVLAARSCLQPASFFTGYTASRHEQAIHRVRTGRADQDSLRRSSMTITQLLALDLHTQQAILMHTSNAWLTLSELVEAIGETRRDIEREALLLVGDGRLMQRRRAICGRGRPAVEFTRAFDT
jgi:hypothetical protein